MPRWRRGPPPIKCCRVDRALCFHEHRGFWSFLFKRNGKPGFICEISRVLKTYNLHNNIHAYMHAYWHESEIVHSEFFQSLVCSRAFFLESTQHLCQFLPVSLLSFHGLPHGCTTQSNFSFSSSGHRRKISHTSHYRKHLKDLEL